MVKKEKINFEIPAFVFGIIAIVQAIFTPLVGLIFGIIGVVMSYRQKTPLSNRAKILNWIGIVIGAVLFVLVLVLSLSGSQFANYLG
jgi:fumarate reductase subunit D